MWIVKDLLEKSVKKKRFRRDREIFTQIGHLDRCVKRLFVKLFLKWFLLNLMDYNILSSKIYTT